MTEALARKRFEELKRRSGNIPDEELDELWTTLRPVTIDFMIGEWRGGEFRTGHRINGLLEKAGWFGKTMNSATDVKPLICLDADGNKFSNVKLGKGEASLWLEEFRGEVTATMVYDGQAIHDHFKEVDADTVMGIMNGKDGLDFASGTAKYGYFYLERL